MDVNITEIYSINNNNETHLENEQKNYTIWTVSIYFGAVIIGVIINLLLVIGLIRQKKPGTLYLILQISLIDILSTGIATAEIWSIFTVNWQFNSIACPIFLGSEVLINVISIYMHILLNFHAISAWNLQKNTKVCNKNPLTSDESNECLMWQEPPNRTVNIDYRYKRATVSIILPSILLWFSCISLSIPEFTLSTTVQYHTNQTLCTIIDLHYTQLLQFLLILFRGIIPLPLLVLTFLIVLYKLFNNFSVSEVKKNCTSKKYQQLKLLLILSLAYSSIYILCSLQRSVFHILHLMNQHYPTITLDNFKMPPFDNFILEKYTNMYLSMLHYLASVFRPIVFIYIMPNTMSMYRKCFIRT